MPQNTLMGMEDREDVRGDDVKKGTGVHIATPYPAKKAGKSDKSKQETPKSAATPVACNTCSKTFNSEKGLESHSNAKQAISHHLIPAEDDDDDSDVDLFGEETEEEKKAAEERAAAVKASDKKKYPESLQFCWM
ncbi:uncharacterized protein LOC113292783 [Papaver somniferum]|uniref:uncharacterized protein LOC113292783 n=1 Tax=Papaver somniferum TaxID=3469 RepID=UPI000E6FD9F6|nr:uncharacterized protein LOC113292783 [Papaver somniferum]